MKSLHLKKLHYGPALWALLFLFACADLPNHTESQTTPYTGVGLHQVSPQTTIVTGTIKYKAYAGGNILVEARRSVPCQYGRCPVIGEPPLDQQDLSAPGAYSLQLPQSGDGVMIIATLFPPSGGVRVAHTEKSGEASQISNVDLSLDRPYPPLR